MVQREVADRFFAAPATKAYGAVSVLMQLATERTGFHPVSREVFRPRPNVDSALVAFRRTAPGLDPAVKRLVEAAFAHRRKTLANSLALAGARDPRARRRRRSPRSAAAPASRAEELAPAEFVALADRARDDRAPPRTRRSTSRWSSAPTRPDGLHEVATILQRVELADTDLARAGRRADASRASRPTRSSAARSSALAARGRRRAGLARADREADPGRRRPRRRQLRRGDGAPARLRAARGAARRRRRLHAIARRARRRRAVLPRARAAARDRRRARGSSRLELPQDYTVAAPAAARGGQALDGGGLRGASPARAGFEERRARVLELAAAGSSADLAALPAERPRQLAARRAAARARRVPRRRQRRRPGRLRALRRAGTRRGRAARRWPGSARPG